MRGFALYMSIHISTNIFPKALILSRNNVVEVMEGGGCTRHFRHLRSYRDGSYMSYHRSLVIFDSEA